MENPCCQGKSDCKKPCCKQPCPCPPPCPCPQGAPCPPPCMDKKLMKKMKKKAKKEITIALEFLCPEWDCMYKMILMKVILCMLKEKCKSMCGKGGVCGKMECCKEGGECTKKECCKEGTCKKECCKEGGCCKEGECCKKECGKEECCTKKAKCPMKKMLKCMVRELCKCFVGTCKDMIKEMIDVAIASFKKLRGELPPFCKKFKHHFVKAVAKLLHKMHVKGGECKEMWGKIADKFWPKKFEKMECKMKKKAKKVAELAMFYAPGPDCELRKMVGKKCLTQLLVQKWKMHMQMMKKCHKDKEECKGKPECKSECKEPCGEKGGKCMKKKMKQECIKFVLSYLKDSEECLKMCTEGAKEAVETAFKDCKKCTEKCKMKLIAKIVAKCACCCGCGEKKTKEQCLEFANKYIKGFVCCCDKKCVKRCKDTVKTAMRLVGIKEKCILHIGSRWGAIMCCQTNGKAGCPKDVCAEFTGKWVKDFTPAIVEACNVLKELTKDCCKDCPCGDYEAKTISRKLILCYLKMNCLDGKFNKAHFTAFVNEKKEKMAKFAECCMKKCEAGPCQATTGPCCQKPEVKK